MHIFSAAAHRGLKRHHPKPVHKRICPKCGKNEAAPNAPYCVKCQHPKPGPHQGGKRH